MINLIIDGFLYAFGAISYDLKNHYHCQEWAVSLVISLACGFYLLSGNSLITFDLFFLLSYANLAPIASALCNKWGCRPIGIIGSFIAAFAVAASILSPTIYIMWLLFGFIGGIGMGLVYLPSIVMVGYYFEEKRAIATGKKLSVLFFLKNNGKPSIFRYCHGRHGYWLNYIRTTFKGSISIVGMEVWFTHTSWYSSLMCCLLCSDGSFKTNPQTTHQ